MTRAGVTEGRPHITPTPADPARFGPAVSRGLLIKPPTQSSLPEEDVGQGEPLRCHQMRETGLRITR